MIRTYILNKSYFISFEGIDGSGKSTQAKLLIERLNSNSIETCFVREPGGTKISEEIRNILLDDRAEEMSSRTEALLMCASRAQLTKNIITPELKAGKWVIADRYSDSTLAYQGGGRGIDLDWLVRLNNFATFGIEPDVTFYIDIDPNIGLQRRKNISADRIESAGLEFQNEIRNKYLEIIDNFSNRCVLVDGKLSIKEISHLVWKEIKNRTSFE
ncbi:MAG: dTMP kinase [Candidatus Marinimicrobia bacterium]|nr:dTMP kinase [Candidatus Neomarinimicrobiota bacterium]|tara:strand:- start:718 stop:1362 length:645 start_codon:yes stop_codon:yes gene_type:complete